MAANGTPVAAKELNPAAAGGAASAARAAEASSSSTTSEDEQEAVFWLLVSAPHSVHRAWAVLEHNQAKACCCRHEWGTSWTIWAVLQHDGPHRLALCSHRARRWRRCCTKEMVNPA